MMGYFLLRIVVEVFRVVPFRGLYVFSDFLAFLLFRIIGYRKRVVLENLRRAFPEKSEGEIQRIARSSYRNLTDVTLETFKSFTAPLSEIDRRCPCRNPEMVNKYLDRGQSIILTGSHLGNWEYSGLTMPPAFHGPTITAFKPLTNKVLDRYLNHCRSRAGMEMVSMDDVFRSMRRRSADAAVFILLADQSPSSRKSAHWVEFFGQDTASLPGADVLARKFNFPVIHYNVRRLQRGFYEIHFVELCPDPATSGETDITRAYAARLESEIRTQPEGWLWSHKRWKIKPEN